MWTDISQSVSDCLRAGWSVDRFPVGARFSAHVQTGPEAHPASCTIGTSSFLGIKRSGHGVDCVPPYIAEVKERINIRVYRFIAWSRVTFTFI